MRRVRGKRLQVRILAPVLEAALERYQLTFLLVTTAFYFSGCLALAQRRPLWFDELFTAHLSNLSSASQLWAALGAGADVTPPLFNLITRAFVVMFGANQVAYRLPSMIGVWVLGLCLFFFVRRRASIFHAAAAMLVPFCIRSVAYSTEARPYGLVLGGCGVSLLAWQWATEGRRRPLALAVLAASLAATPAVHYYGALFVIPLVLGELLRAKVRKAIDWPVAIALLASPLAVLAHWRFIQVAMSYTGGAWAPANFKALGNAYAFLLGPILEPFALAAVIVSFSLIAIQRRLHLRRNYALPSWEMAAAGSMLVLPIISLLIALITNGIFTPRYAIPTAIGFALSVAIAPLRRTREFAALGMFYFVLFAGIFFGLQGARTAKLLLPRESPVPEELTRALQSHDAIVMSNPHIFLQSAYYLPPSMRAKLFYIASPEYAKRYLDFDDDDRSLVLLRKWAPLNVVDLESFVREHPKFAVLGERKESWLMPKLQDSGVAFLPVVAWDSSTPLWTVNYAARKSTSTGDASTRSRSR